MITLNPQYPKPEKTDTAAPVTLTLTITDANGRIWGTAIAELRHFSTGSVGYFANGKTVNPDNTDARYQVGGNLTLIGSKPGSADKKAKNGKTTQTVDIPPTTPGKTLNARPTVTA